MGLVDENGQSLDGTNVGLLCGHALQMQVLLRCTPSRSWHIDYVLAVRDAIADIKIRLFAVTEWPEFEVGVIMCPVLYSQ